MNGKRGFVKLEKNRIAVMIIPSTAKTNEDYIVPYNSEMALYVTNMAYVERIYNPNTQVDYNVGYEIGYSNEKNLIKKYYLYFKFKVGSYVKAKKFDPSNLDKWDKGIIFYKSIEPVLYEHLDPNYTGKFKRYDHLGRLTADGNMVKGKYNGIINEYNDDQLLSRGQYTNDLLNGIYTAYFDDGSIRQTIPYVNQMKDGNSYTYYKSGEIHSITHYANNLKHGQEIVYDKNGNERSKCNYEKGKRNGKYVEYLNDKPLIEGNYLNDQKVGEWIEYSGKYYRIIVYGQELEPDPVPKVYVAQNTVC